MHLIIEKKLGVTNNQKNINQKDNFNSNFNVVQLIIN